MQIASIKMNKPAQLAPVAPVKPAPSEAPSQAIEPSATPPETPVKRQVDDREAQALARRDTDDTAKLAKVEDAVAQQQRLVSDREAQSADESGMPLEAFRLHFGDSGVPIEERRKLEVMTSQRDLLRSDIQLRIANVDRSKAEDGERYSTTPEVVFAMRVEDAASWHGQAARSRLQQYAEDKDYASATEAAYANFNQALEPSGMKLTPLQSSQIDGNERPGAVRAFAKSAANDEKRAKAADALVTLEQARRDKNPGPRTVEVFVNASRPVTIEGGTASQKLDVIEDLYQIFTTRRGGQVMNSIGRLEIKLDGKRASAHGVVTDNGLRNVELQVDPNSHPLMRIEGLDFPTSTLRIIAHQLGRALGESDRKALRNTENPIIEELGEEILVR